MLAVMDTVISWLKDRSVYRSLRRKRRDSSRQTITDPRLVSYYDPGPGRGCTIIAPVQCARAFNAFTLDSNSFHPWFLAAREGQGGDRASIGRLLASYYSLVQPKSLHDWLDIPADVCSGLAALPVYAWMVLPWTTRNPLDVVQGVEVTQRQENRRYGLNEGMSAGVKAFGPVSDGKLRVEVERIADLVVSIRRHGFRHEHADDALNAVFLVSDGRWRWLAVGGMHRVPVAAGLGITHMPVRAVAVVRRNEVDIWCQVVAGLYDRNTALNVFDRLFEGRAPGCAAAWVDWVKSRRSESPG